MNSLEKKICDLEEKERKIRAQKKLAQAKLNEKERKARTRRLIQIGAIMESIGCDTVEKAEVLKEALLSEEGFQEAIKGLEE